MFTEVSLFVLAAIASFGIVYLLYHLVSDSFESLLDDLLNMPAATAFYSRLLLVCLVLIGISGISDASFEGLGEDAELMEYVWALVDLFESIMMPALLILGLFLITVTVLIASLKPRGE